MKTEILIEQIAEIKALLVISTFMQQTILESMGCDAEVMVTAVDKLNTTLANQFEDAMRKACGLDAREKPRETVLPKLAELDLMRNVDWDKVKAV